MSSQLFLSEVFVTLAAFALGAAGYAMSKHGKAWLLLRRLVQEKLGKVEIARSRSPPCAAGADREIIASFEEQTSQSLAKKSTTQAKNSEARRRAKRQGRSRVQDELLTGTETPSVQDANDKHVKGHEIAPTLATVGSNVEVAEELNVEQAEPMVEMPGSMMDALISTYTKLLALEKEENMAKELFVEQQPLSPESLASTLSGEEVTEEDEEEEEGMTTPVTHDEVELLEHLQQDADEGDNLKSCALSAAGGSGMCRTGLSETAGLAESSNIVDDKVPEWRQITSAVAPKPDHIDLPLKGEDDAEQYEPTTASSEIDGSDVGLQDFTIPSTPPYEDDVLMPTYVLDGGVFPDTPTDSPRGDNGGVFPDTPTSAHSFTYGQQVFEPMPSVTPDGHQLYTDGRQVFMLACVEVPPSDPSTPCVGMQSGLLASTDPFCQLASTCGDFLGDATHDSQAYSGSYGNAVKDDLWNVCWEDVLPEAFPPRAGF